MAIAVLGVRQRGATQFSAVFRMAGNTANQVGVNFTVMVLTTATGTFTPGETVTGGSSGATGVVRQVLASGATPKLFLNTIVGVFTNETVTGGTSGASGTLSTANIGILETAGTAGANIYQDRVLNFRNVLYCVLNNYVIKSSDGGTTWSVAFTNDALLTTGLNCHSGLHVFYVNNQPLLGYIWGDFSMNQIRRATSPDGTTWSTAQIALGFSFNTTNWAGILREIVLNNVLYVSANYSNIARLHSAWDPSNDSFSQVSPTGASGTPSNQSSKDYYIFQNQLLMVAQDATGGHVGLYVFAAGAWTRVLDFTDTGNVTGGGNAPNTSQWTLFDPGDGNLYVIYYAFPNPNVGWVMKKVTYSGGVYTDAGQIQATTLAGTGIDLYPGGPDVETGRWYVVTDDVTTPGTPVTYLYFAPNDIVGTAYTVMQWNGPLAAVTNLGAGGDVALALAHERAGGGERIWTSGQPDILITSIASVTGGMRLFYIVYGGGTKNIQFWYNSFGEVEKLAATLSSPSVGTLHAGNQQIDNVPADGVTVNQVTWLAGPTGDNVPNFTRAQLQPVAL